MPDGTSHGALSTTWLRKVKKAEPKLKLGQCYKLFRRLNNLFKADLVFPSLAKWRWKTDTIARRNIAGDKCHTENRITPKYFSWRSAGRDSWRILSRDFFFRLEPLSWGLGSTVSLHSQKLGIASIYHCPSISHDEWGEETAGMPSGCNLKTARQPPGTVEEMYTTVLTIHNVQKFYSLIRHCFSSLSAIKAAKAPKRKEKKKSPFLILWRNSDSFGLNNE